MFHAVISVVFVGPMATTANAIIAEPAVATERLERCQVEALRPQTKKDAKGKVRARGRVRVKCANPTYVGVRTALREKDRRGSDRLHTAAWGKSFVARKSWTYRSGPWVKCWTEFGREELYTIARLATWDGDWNFSRWDRGRVRSAAC